MCDKVGGDELRRVEYTCTVSPCGVPSWQAEILVLGRLRHPNLVRLVGYCADQGEGLLVYEYLANGSLDYHLFSKYSPVLPAASADPFFRKPFFLRGNFVVAEWCVSN